MPTFQMYSKLDKNLLKRMIIRCTELHDREIDELRQQLFNPEPDDDMSLSAISESMSRGNKGGSKSSDGND